MTSYKERLNYVGNGNKPHGGLRRYAERIGIIRTPEEKNKNIYNRKSRENCRSPKGKHGKKLQP